MNHTTIVMCLLVIVLIIIIFINKLRKLYNYWNNRGIVGPRPLPVLGNYASVIFRLESEADLLRKLYETYPKEKIIGLFKGIHPVLLIRDRNIIKQILLKDFDNFNVRCIEDAISVYNKSLYVMDGDASWKILRNTFSSGLEDSKITVMIPKINASLQNYLRYIENLTENHTHFDVRNLNNKYVLDTFSKLIFGQNMKVYVDDGEYEKTVLRSIKSKLRLSILQIINLTCPVLLKHVSYILFTKFDYFYIIYKEFIALLLKNLSDIKDKEIQDESFLSFLLELKKKELLKSFDIDDDFIIQQTMTFFLAAFEPISNTLTLLMYELSQNKDIQNKCIKEVDNILGKYTGQTIRADILSEMKYLQTVVDETLRKHAVADAIDRKCIKKYILPDEDITIDKGVSLLIPIHGLHYDPKYFLNPETFNPERFSPENKADIIEYSYLPFGEGPRMCIGSRLAKVVILIGMIGFLRNFEVQPTNKYFKLKHDPKRIRATTTSEDIWLKIKRRRRQ